MFNTPNFNFLGAIFYLLIYVNNIKYKSYASIY